MKPAIARLTRKHLLVIFLGLSSTFSFGSSAWSHTAQNQNCSGKCESDESQPMFLDTKALDFRTASFTPVGGTGGLQSAKVSNTGDIRAATPGSTLSHTDQGTTRAYVHNNPAIEGGSFPEPRFFLLIGLALIVARLVISYRSKKVKSLATGSHSSV